MDEGLEELFSENEMDVDVSKDQIVDQDSPIVKLVNQILSNATTSRASDIHLDPHETKLVIRYRVDGILRTERTLPKHMQSMLTARIKIMANLDITEHRIPQDGRIKINVGYHPIDLRVSTLPTVYGEKIVLRLLDLGTALVDLNNLGFNSLNLKRFHHMLEKPTGIILITGPTGSGKSSTLYAALNHLNSEEVKYYYN